MPPRTHHAISTDRRRHITTNVVADEETDDEASVASKLTPIVVEKKAIRPHAPGLYRGKFVKTDDGWKISHRRMEL